MLKSNNITYITSCLLSSRANWWVQRRFNDIRGNFFKTIFDLDNMADNIKRYDAMNSINNRQTKYTDILNHKQ